jgi:hypothetical protein
MDFIELKIFSVAKSMRSTAQARHRCIKGLQRPCPILQESLCYPYFTGENAILGNMGQPTPAVVSFQVVWTATGGVNVFNNTAQQFRGEFRNAEAHMEYSGRAGEFRFQSAPLGDSTTVAAELGQESNGSFY